jgi:hypothetical protein
MRTQQGECAERGNERRLTAALPHEMSNFCIAEQMQRARMRRGRQLGKIEEVSIDYVRSEPIERHVAKMYLLTICSVPLYTKFIWNALGQ